MRETIVDRAYAKTLLPPRKEDGHKGDFGKLLVLGGSVGYTGAPVSGGERGGAFGLRARVSRRAGEHLGG